MYKTIYRFSVQIQEKPICFPLHLCVYQDKPPQFHELVEKIRHAAQDLSINDYYITIDNQREQTRNMLYDDHTFQNALKSVADQKRLEIILCRKQPQSVDPPSAPLSPPSLPQLIPDNNVPVIKPTVYRWIPATHAEARQSFSRQGSVASWDEDLSSSSYSIRKDSGISFDEPIKKKQRVMSADQSLQTRKLPDLSPPAVVLHHFQHHHHHHHHQASPILHPLDPRRPSTAPSSPPSFPRRTASPITITLPAISSITSSETDPLHTQLAPIQQQLSPATSFTQSQSNSPEMSKLEAKHHHQQTSHHLLAHGGNGSAVGVGGGQFLCEHIVDPSSGRMCGQTFRRSYDLSRHQTIHLKNRPFCYCEQCGKKFTRMDALRRHERVQGHSSKHRLHHHSSSRHLLNRAQQARV